MTQKIIWRSHPGPQTEVLKRTEFEILYGGARGGGKTDAGMAWLLRHINNPKYRALIIRRNADDLSDWIDRAREMYQDTGAKFAYRPAVITFPSGAIFRTGHLKDENAYGKYIGHEYQRMVIEELTQIPTEERYLKLLSSCRSTSDIKPQIFATTNPGEIGHDWVKKRFIDVAPAGDTHVDSITNRTRIYIPAKLTDNPALMRSNPEYLSWLEGLPERLKQAWLEGNWDIVAGHVFTEWNKETHVVKPFPIPKGWKRWVAIDWGINAPMAIGWYAQDYDSRTYLYRELYMNGIKFYKIFGAPVTAKRVARVILKIMKKANEDYEYCVADPSMWNRTLMGKTREIVEGESVAELMIDAGLNLLAGDNNRLHGIERYRQALSIAPDGKPWYLVFASCVDTIRTIPLLPYNLKGKHIEEVDTDAEDHCYDRDRYFFMSRPAKPILQKKPKVSIIKRELIKAERKWKNEEADEENKEWREWNQV